MNIKNEENMTKEKTVIVESTGWKRLEINLVSNYQCDIVLGERIYNEESKCYVQEVKGDMPSGEVGDLYDQLKHYHGDCDDDCIYCNEKDDCS